MGVDIFSPRLNWTKAVKSDRPLISHGLFNYVILFSGMAYYLVSKMDEGHEKVSGPHMTELKARQVAEKMEDRAKKRKRGAV